MTLRGYVVVSGLPGSGKSTVALPLAHTLSLPLIAKDDIKEALARCIPVQHQSGSAVIGRASMEVLWALAARTDAAVLESHWLREFAVQQLRRLGRPVVEVFCNAPKAVCAERFRERMAHRHIGHAEQFLTDDELTQMIEGWPDPAPLGVGTLIEIDTTRSVDIHVVAQQVAAELGSVSTRAT